MKRKNFLAGITILILVMVLNLGCSSEVASDKNDGVEEEAIAVEVIRAIEGEVETLVGYSGRIKPIQEIMITPKQPGKVVKINFDLGQRVKAGQVLFHLDKTDALLQLNQASAAVELAKINLNKMSGSTYEQQMIQLKTSLSSAEINYNDAKANYETIKVLYNAGAESKFNYDRAESQFKLAKEQYEAAKANYELSEEKSFLENIELSEIQLKQSEAAYNLAQNAVNNMDVKSPINGVISAKNLKVGEFASNASVAFVIIDDSSYTIEVDVSEGVIGKIEAGDKARVYVESISKDPLIGTVKAVAPSADMQKQTYLVRIILDDPPSTIKGGMFAEVKLTTDRVEGSLVAPLSSIVDEGDKKYIYIADGDKALKTEVVVGISNDKEIEILEGLDASDMIITKGHDFLKNGSTIRISK